MKAICEGRKTRQEVVEETIEQYLAVYNRTQQRLNVLKAVSPGRVQVVSWSSRVKLTSLLHSPSADTSSVSRVERDPRPKSHPLEASDCSISFGASPATVAVSCSTAISGSIHHTNIGRLRLIDVSYPRPSKTSLCRKALTCLVHISLLVCPRRSNHRAEKYSAGLHARIPQDACSGCTKNAIL